MLLNNLLKEDTKCETTSFQTIIIYFTNYILNRNPMFGTIGDVVFN